MSPCLLVKGLSCKSEWAVVCSTCFSLTAGFAILSHTERRRRSVVLKLNGSAMVKIYPW